MLLKQEGVTYRKQVIFTKSLHNFKQRNTVVVTVCRWCKQQHSRYFDQLPTPVCCPHCGQE